LTEIPIYESWTIKDLLAHIIGWDEHVIHKLNLLLQHRADLITAVDVEAQNRQAVTVRQAKSLPEILSEMQSTHQQIVDILSAVALSELDRRHEVDGLAVTIRSYVLDAMIEHERRHAVEVELWRRELEQTIDPAAIKANLRQSRINFMNTLVDHFAEADVLDKTVVGVWSINDLVGHIAVWEQRMLTAAYHIYDPSRPAVPPLPADHTAGQNKMMAAARAGKSWPENHHYLRETQAAVDNFVASLRPGDWRLRGPYPWPDDQGTLAELVTHIVEHYDDHLPDLKRWSEKKQP
jgi:hypothetical protein